MGIPHGRANQNVLGDSPISGRCLRAPSPSSPAGNPVPARRGGPDAYFSPRRHTVQQSGQKLCINTRHRNHGGVLVVIESGAYVFIFLKDCNDVNIMPFKTCYCFSNRD